MTTSFQEMLETGLFTRLAALYCSVFKTSDHNQENETKKCYNEVIKLIKESQSELVSLVNNVSKDKNRTVITLASLHFDMGMLHDRTKDLKSAEEQFMKCIDLLRGRELEPTAVLVVIGALNQLGLLWSSWNQPEKAKEFLERAEQIYKDFTSIEHPDQEPEEFEFLLMTGNTDIYNVTDMELSSKNKLEIKYNMTLYYLAQVLLNLKNHHKSAIYCHLTLRRQLEQEKILVDFDYIEWALNAASLSQYFTKNGRFTQARHYLAAASYILQKYENIMKEENAKLNSEKAAAAEEEFNYRSADVAMCWAKYGLSLLHSSKKRLLKKADSDESDLDETTEESQSNSKSEKDTEKSFDDLKFDILLDDIKPFADQITDTHLLVLNDAKSVFLNIKKWLDIAKAYYTLENYASDYVKIIQDMSFAYKCLSFFEENEDRQAKMHKRRIDILEATVKELHPQYYKDTCRELWTEIADIYSNILDIKLDRIRINDEYVTPRALTKMNHLAESSIKYLQLFLDSLDNNSKDPKNITFPEGLVYTVLATYFHMGKLYCKITSTDKSELLENIQKSIDAYQFVIDYCETHPEALEEAKQIWSYCKEIVSLLPLKANRIRQELMNE